MIFSIWVLPGPRRIAALAVLATASLVGQPLNAEPFIAPGRAELRIDLQQLADEGVIDAPITAWPLSWQSLVADLENADLGSMSPETRAAFDRVATELGFAELTHRFLPHVRIGIASEPIAVRSFASTPRAEGELEAGISYTGNRFSYNLNLMRAWDSPDDWRADGSYIGFALDEWSVVAGLPERWWGPGMQGSLILSTNARPLPQIGVQRLSANGFDRPWLRWIGPWSMTSFIGQFDDDRVVNDALLFGLRLTARPLPQLEFGLSRAAQLCGDGRPCGGSQFFDMLTGRDNAGRRGLSKDEEPGNQLAGFDFRWSFANLPFAAYMQWIGEDSRGNGTR
ncbi:MAG: capsule assembly Wzi family protein, partial [Gammaproteobacteria bacterium]